MNDRKPMNEIRGPAVRGPAAASAAFILFVLLALGSCSGPQGWGVLLWSVEDPAIPSGTVLPVYIKSNIDSVWVVGVPDAPKGAKDKIELPLWRLELVGSKRKAKAYALKFAEFASVYAETVQDGLAIRAEPDNLARRLYRLRQGQIVKVLDRAAGNPVMTGDKPLPGEWLHVLTEDGEKGYCFSYRLRLFDHTAGPLVAATAGTETKSEDPKLDLVFSRAWYPESYKEMVDSRRIDLSAFSTRWGFFPGQDTGIARISLPNIELSYPYGAVNAVREGSWRLDGTSLQMTLRSESTLAVQYTDASGAQRTLIFVALGSDVEDLIAQETDRREALFNTLYKRGPAFSSENYGALTFAEGGTFTWTGFDLLRPSIVSAEAKESGTAELRLFLDDSLVGVYDGAVSLRFDGMGEGKTVDFLYALEPNGIRLEYLSASCLEGAVVKRRASAPTVIFFSRVEP